MQRDVPASNSLHVLLSQKPSVVAGRRRREYHPGAVDRLQQGDKYLMITETCDYVPPAFQLEQQQEVWH